MRIAYLMSRFPHLPETFILREMEMVKKMGNEVLLFPLILQNQSVVHLNAQKWLLGDDLNHPNVGLVLKANSSLFLRKPKRLLSVLLKILAGNAANPKFLLRALYLFPLAVAMSVQMQTRGVEHIHAHYATHPALAAWIIHQLTGITYSVTVHAHDIFVSQTMLREKLGSAAFIRAISSYNKEFLIQNLGSDFSEKIFVIHTGIDPDLYIPDKRNKDGFFRFINIGSLQPYKGQTYLLQACKILKNKGYSFQCVIIGQGELKDSLQTMIEELGIEDRVSLVGAKTEEEVSHLLPGFDGYVQPSIITPSGKMEGIPVAIMEAMACEVPVIATAISGVPELVEDQKTGILIHPQNSEELATAMENLIRNPEISKKMVALAKKRVIKDFDLEANVKKLNALFQAR